MSRPRETPVCEEAYPDMTLIERPPALVLGAAELAAPPSLPALSISRLEVKADRMICDVVVRPGVRQVLTPSLAARIAETFPQLCYHACVNEEGSTFAAVMDHATLPHVLEHLVIDLQTRATPPGGDTVFVGITRWTDEFSGCARIEVSFTDDLVALRAFRDATHFLNKVMVF